MKRDKRRAVILNAALEVFARKGYHAASVSDIIAKASVARGTFYLYFGSKRAVFEQLLDELLAMLFASVKRIDPSRGPEGVLAQMEANIDAVLDLMLENRPMLRILLGGASGLDPGFDRKINEFYDRLVALTTHSLDLGQQMGIIRPVNSQVVALCIIGSIKEVLFQISTGRKLPSREELLQEILAYGIKGVLHPRMKNLLGNKAEAKETPLED